MDRKDRAGQGALSAKVSLTEVRLALTEVSHGQRLHRSLQSLLRAYRFAASMTSCGIAESEASAANNRCAASLSHTTIEPEPLSVNSPIGTVTVVIVAAQRPRQAGRDPRRGRPRRP